MTVFIREETLNNYQLIVALQKFDVLKTNIYPRSEALRENMLVLRTINFLGETIRQIVLRQLYRLYCSPLNFLPCASLKILDFSDESCDRQM